MWHSQYPGKETVISTAIWPCPLCAINCACDPDSSHCPSSHLAASIPQLCLATMAFFSASFAAPAYARQLTPAEIHVRTTEIFSRSRVRARRAALISILTNSFVRPVALMPKIFRKVKLETVRQLILTLPSERDSIVARNRRYRVIGIHPDIHFRAKKRTRTSLKRMADVGLYHIFWLLT